MGKRFYRFTAGVVRALCGRMRTEWEVPFQEGACVFVVNNTGLTGTADMCARFEKREKCHPWINDAMTDPKRIPDYVRKDFWWKPGTWYAPLLSATVPGLAAALMPPILKGMPYVPVYHDQRIMLTLRQSVRVLQKEEALIIFPEQPGRDLSHHEWISTGWMRLGELWYRSSGRALKMYPVHIDRKQRLIRVAAPVRYDPARSYREQEKELAAALSRGMRGA